MNIYSYEIATKKLALGTLCMLRFIFLSSLALVALSYTRRKTFQYVPRELANVVPRRFLPFFP
jgi:hypothetical protein